MRSIIKPLIVIAFQVVLIGSLNLLLIGCDSAEPPNDTELPNDGLKYDQLPHIQHWDDIQTAVDETGLWLIYFFHKQCPACHHIEPDVAHFIDTNASTYPVYLAESPHVQGEKPDLDIKYVPTFIVVYDNTYIEFHTGVNAVLALLAALSDGSYLLPS